MATKTVTDIVNLFENGQLNLSSAFQKGSVWQEKGSANLIESIICNYPLPAIVLYGSKSGDGQIINEVNDGKQRIESGFFQWLAVATYRFGPGRYRDRCCLLAMAESFPLGHSC